jgi:hypothetical protein
MDRQAFATPVPSLVAATTGNGVVVPVNHCRKTTNVIKFGAGTNAGTIVVESSDSAGGPWTAQGAPVAWVAASTELEIVIDHRVGFIRHRVSVNVTGGVVDSNVQGDL